MRDSICGLEVVVATEHPKYVLPDEVMPGVSWPAGFKVDIDAWARARCGTTCFVEQGQMLVMGQRIIMHPADYQTIRNQLPYHV